MTGNFGSMYEGFRSLGAIGAGNLGPHDTWYVDPLISGGDGKSWRTAFDTMTEAIDAAGDNDLILLTGTLTESIDYSDGGAANAKSNITILGADTSYNSPIWIPESTSHLINLDCPGWTIQNIRFVVPAAGYASLYLNMDEAAHGAYLTKVIDCSFTGGAGSAVQLEGAPNGVQIVGCQFNTITGYGIRNNATGFAAVGAMYVAYNRFTDCVKQIELNQCGGTIFFNNFFEGKSTATRHLYFKNPSGSHTNIMLGNYFGGDYSTTGGYKFNTLDGCVGNWSDDQDEAEVDAGGHVLAIPT